jgi:hypothetical protein
VGQALHASSSVSWLTECTLSEVLHALVVVEHAAPVEHALVVVTHSLSSRASRR